MFWRKADLKDLPDTINKYKLPISIDKTFYKWLKTGTNFILHYNKGKFPLYPTNNSVL